MRARVVAMATLLLVSACKRDDVAGLADAEVLPPPEGLPIILDAGVARMLEGLPAGDDGDEERIIGGMTGQEIADAGADLLASDEAFASFQVALVERRLLEDGTHALSAYCSGTLIGPNRVLTAAHCLGRWHDDEVCSPEYLFVVAGATELADARRDVIGVRRCERHPDYVFKTKAHDMAVIVLDRAPRSDLGMQPVWIPAEPVLPQVPAWPAIDEPLVVSGWGLKGTSGTMSPVLRRTVVASFDHAACVEVYRDTIGWTVAEGTACAYYPERGACRGDSGGPLLLQRDGRIIQAGIVSKGKDCGAGDLPGVYTDVSAHLDFLWEHG